MAKRSVTKSDGRIAIIGCGNIGTAIARGLVSAGVYDPGQLILTRRQVEPLGELAQAGFTVQADNRDAVRQSDIVMLAVQPQQMVEVLSEIVPDIRQDHVIFSIVSGVSIAEVIQCLGQAVPVIRVMPNTAIEIGESITCLAALPEHGQALDMALALFGSVGNTMIITEELMVPATALGACGVAFFLRCIRAASQGGIEIGFHPHEALLIAAQTARGAASLVLEQGEHPEAAIDVVTTPRGATIAGLNNMEHEGLSSALIKGIVTSAGKVAGLFAREN
ncbi:MAG: pyrroline-5-carboxylate reductase [Fidelibacterota bacterium]|nr:MAG: pyrroline-5-carboxylate reductase [Candidatus Neomarinimicrobiota bacterium]